MGNDISATKQTGGFISSLPAEINYAFKTYLDGPSLSTASSTSRYGRHFSAIERQNVMNTEKQLILESAKRYPRNKSVKSMVLIALETEFLTDKDDLSSISQIYPLHPTVQKYSENLRNVQLMYEEVNLIKVLNEFSPQELYNFIHALDPDSIIETVMTVALNSGDYPILSLYPEHLMQLQRLSDEYEANAEVNHSESDSDSD